MTAGMNDVQREFAAHLLATLPDTWDHLSIDDRIDPDFDLNAFAPDHDDLMKDKIELEIKSAKVLQKIHVNDCKNVFGWTPNPVQKKIMHLGVLKDDMAQQGHMSPALLTHYASQVYGNLIPELKVLSGLVDPLWPTREPKIDWAFCDALTARGFAVTYNRATRTLAIAVGKSAVVLSV